MDLIGKKPAPTGAAGVIDERRLGREGIKLLGGMVFGQAIIAQLQAIRAKSSDIQERAFLGEIEALVQQGLQVQHDKLAAHAMKRKAIKLIEDPDKAKAH